MTKHEAPATEAQKEAQREEAFQALERAMHDRTEGTVQAGLTLARAWLAQHPTDWAMRDAGEPVAMLADALEIVARAEREEKARERRDVPAVAASEGGGRQGEEGAASVQVSSYAGVQVSSYAGVQVSSYAGVQVSSYAGSAPPLQQRPRLGPPER